MLGILQDVLEAIGYIPQYILYAIETVVNGFFAGIQDIFNAATSLIPLPEVPGPPEYISAINWFFPVGSLISILVPVVGGYVTFLAIRWIYRWSGNL